jgi:mycofactocin precursor
MTRTDELTTTLPPEAGAITPAGAAAPAGADVEEPQELLIEEISIDGMCGVY